jgi:hypothetical protein
MMSHLQEVEDAAARDGVYTFQTQMEIFVLSLLDQNHEIALTQIAAARTVSLDYVNNLDSVFHSVDHDEKAGRVAVAMLERTFDHLRRVLETPDGDGLPFKAAH